MERRNPTCIHCGSGTVVDGIGTNIIYYKCTRTGCRCLIVSGRDGTKVVGECLTMYRTGREIHSVPVA